MGIEIQFPKNFERYIQLGQEAMAKNDFAGALTNFLSAYEIAPDFPLNFLIANTLYELGETEDALAIAHEFKADYEKNIDYLALYVQLLMMNEEFVDAHKVINTRMLKHIPEEMERLVRFKNEVHHYELIAQRREQDMIDKLYEELLKLPDYPAKEQFALTGIAKKLPEEEFIAAAEKLLVNNKVQVLVKSWFLQELSELGVPDEIQFLWMNGEKRSVSPEEIGKPEDSESFHAVKDLLKEKLEHEDPVLLENLKQEVALQFAVLYPFSDEVVADPKIWTAAILDTYSELPEDNCDKVLDEVKNEQAKISELLAEIYL